MNLTMTNEALENLLRKKKALLKGHFVLSSTLHSDEYVQTAQVLQYPEIASDLGKKLSDLFEDTVDVVISPAIGGLVIGQEVARARGCRAIFAERDQEGSMALRRNFELKPDERVLIIEDVITTGKSTREVLRIAESYRSKVVGIGSIINRGGPLVKLAIPNVQIHSLLNMKNMVTWQPGPETCPLCKDGIPAVKPGSRKI